MDVDVNDGMLMLMVECGCGWWNVGVYGETWLCMVECGC